MSDIDDKLKQICKVLIMNEHSDTPLKHTERTDMSQPTSDEQRDFNPNDARTWDDKQQQVYETGHREGESCECASWTLMLDEAFDIEASTPDEAKAAIAAHLATQTTQARIDELEQLDKCPPGLIYLAIGERLAQLQPHTGSDAGEREER